MKNKIFAKLIMLFVFSTFLAVMLCGFASCKKKISIPSVQGSNVAEITYEEIVDDYTVETFSDFSKFSNSQWANYSFNSHELAKNERYSKEYFKNFDLITIKFNMPEKGIDFTIIDVSITDNLCTVVLLPCKKISEIIEEPTTYCCFVETSVDVSNLQVELRFEETVLHDSRSFSYITSNNEFYVFENRVEPTVFVVNDKNGIEEFIEYDEILNKQSYIYRILRNCNEEIFEQYSLMLLRVFSSDFENLAVFLDNNELNIVGTYSNHYLFEREIQHHKLVALLIPKDTNITEISRTVYYEYEDNLKVKSTFNIFSLSEQSNISENVIRFSFVKDYD